MQRIKITPFVCAGFPGYTSFVRIVRFECFGRRHEYFYRNEKHKLYSPSIKRNWLIHIIHGSYRRKVLRCVYNGMGIFRGYEVDGHKVLTCFRFFVIFFASDYQFKIGERGFSFCSRPRLPALRLSALPVSKRITVNCERKLFSFVWTSENLRLLHKFFALNFFLSFFITQV